MSSPARLRSATLADAEQADSVRYARWAAARELYGGETRREYPFRCYARWLTMLRGGLMVDFDVFNYGLTPKMVFDISRLALSERVIHFSGDATPCAEYGTPAAFERYCQVFDDFIEHPVATTEYLKAHVHDLNILAANRHVWQPIKMCSLYPNEELWDRYPMTHFTHGFVKYPRSTRVRRLRRFKKTGPLHRLAARYDRSRLGSLWRWFL